MIQDDKKFKDKFLRYKFFKIEEEGEAMLTVFISDEKWEDSFAMISLGDIHLMMFAESNNYIGKCTNRSIISNLNTKAYSGTLKFSETEEKSVSDSIKQHLIDIWSNTSKKQP